MFIVGCQLLIFWTVFGPPPAPTSSPGNLGKHRSVSLRACQTQSAALKENTFDFKNFHFGFGHRVGLKCRNIYRSLPLGGRMVRFQPFSLLFFQLTLYDQMFAKTKRGFQSSPTCENSKIRAHLKYIDDNVGFKVKPARLHFHLGRHFVTYLSPLSTSRM